MAESQDEFDLSEFTNVREEEFDSDGEDGEWVELDDGESLTGELVRMQEDAGKYDSRVYEIDRHDGNENTLIWGNGSIDSQIDNSVNPGDLVHIERNGTYENKYGEFDNYDVMVKRQESTKQDSL